MARVIAILKLPKSILEQIYRAKHVSESVAKEPLFVSPRPPLAVLDAHIAAVEEAQVVAQLGPHGSAAARNAKLAVVRGDLVALCNYVQGVADANPEIAAALIEAAGMYVMRSSGHGKPTFAAKQGKVSGLVHLYARALRTRGSYQWEYSVDGVTWIRVTPTVGAHVEIAGLISGKRYFFRYSTISKAGVSDWSDAVFLVVL